MKLKLLIFILLFTSVHSFSAAQAVTVQPFQREFVPLVTVALTPTPTMILIRPKREFQIKPLGTVSPAPSAVSTPSLTITPTETQKETTETVEGAATTGTQVSEEPKAEKGQPNFGIKEMAFLGLIALLLAIIILQAVLGKGRKEEGSSESPKPEDQEE